VSGEAPWPGERIGELGLFWSEGTRDDIFFRVAVFWSEAKQFDDKAENVPEARNRRLRRSTSAGTKWWPTWPS
jgi:hypothetical protein